MIKLENLQGIKLSRGIRNLSPIQHDSIQIKNKLLDGSFHIQTIGQPLRYFAFEMLSNHKQVEKIDIAEYIGENLTLTIGNKIYTGMIDGKLDWDRFGKRYKDNQETLYTTNIKLNILKEDTI